MTWRLFCPFREAASGVVPTSVADTHGSAVNLAITYDGVTNVWTSDTSGNGLQFPDDTGARCTNASLSSSKLAFSTGIVAATFEAVVEFPGTIVGSRGLFEFVGTGGFVLSADHTIASLSGSFDGAAWNLNVAPSTGVPVHIAVVLDPTNATAADRCRVYLDGSLVSSSNAFVGSEALQALTDLWLGFTVTGGGCTPCIVYEVAFADHAASGAEIAARATALLADNDADPEAGTTTGPTYVGSTAYADSNATTATPDLGTIASYTPTSGDVIVAFCHYVNGGDNNYPTAPAGEGWSKVTGSDVQNQTGANSASNVFWKRWGDAGQTDDSTPTFGTFAGAGSLAVVLSVWRAAKATGNPCSIAAGTNNGAGGATATGGNCGTTPTSPVASAMVFFGGLPPASNFGAPSGTGYTSAYSGAGYSSGSGTDRAVAAAYDQDIVEDGTTGAGVTATAGATLTAWTSITVVIEGAGTAAGGGAQTVTASAITSAEAFGTDQINRTLPAGAIATLESFGTAALAQNILAQAITTAEAVPSPTVTSGLSVLPNAIASAETHGSPQLDRTLPAGAVSTAEQHGTTNVQLAIAPTAIASLEQHGSPQLDKSLPAGSVASAETHGTAAIERFVVAAAIASLEQHGQPTIVLVLLPASTASGEQHGQPTLQSEQIITTSGVGTGEAIGDVAVLSGSSIQPTGVATAEQFGTAQLDRTLLVDSIASLEQFGAAVLELFVATGGIATLEQVGQPVIISGASIAPNAIASLEAFGAAINLDRSLPAGAIATLEAFGGAVIIAAGQDTVITVSSVASLEAFGIPAVEYRDWPRTITHQLRPFGDLRVRLVRP